MRNIFYNIVLCSIILLLAISSVSAFEFDNLKTYDANTKTATITNSIGAFGIGIPTSKIAEITLNTEQDYHIGAGYQMVAQFTINSYEDYTDIIKSFELKDLRNKNNLIERNIDIKYLTTEPIKINDYEKICNKITNGTLICSEVIIGNHLENKEVWLPFDNSIKVDGKIIIGLFTDVKVGDKIEWIPTIAGVKISEWATWTEDLNVGLVRYFKLDEGSGTIAIDSTGTLNGSIVGSAYITGKLGTALNASSLGKYFWSNAPTTTNYTIAGWYKMALGGGEQDAITLGDVELYIKTNGTIGGESGSGVFWGNQTITANTFNLIILKNDASGYTSLKVNNVLSYKASISGLNGGNWTFPRVGANMYGIAQDEIGIWNLATSDEQDTQLWNGGNGITWIGTFTSPPSVTLNSPVNAFNSSTQNIIFNCTGSDNTELKNVSLYVNETLKQTNTSGINNSNYIFSETLLDGYYNWTCGAVDNEVTGTNATERNLTIDTTYPIINIVNPLNSSTILSTTPIYNLTFNFTASDANLNSCWYNNGTSNVSYSCNQNGTTLNLSAGWNTLIAYVNDTIGHLTANSTMFFINYYDYLVNYTTPIVEGINSNITFNLSATSITSVYANVSYNGTIYPMSSIYSNSTFTQFKYNFSVPEVSADSNVNISINFILNGNSVNSSNYSQLIYNIPDLNITSLSCDNKSLKFTLKDEGNLTDINGTFNYNFVYGIGTNLSHARANGNITNMNTFYVCINSTISNNWTLSSGEIFYSSPSYVDRRYYLFDNTNLTNQTNNITLYDLISSAQTSFKLEVEGTSLNPYIDKFTTLVRYYPDLSEYNVVDMGHTDETGATIIHVRTEDVDYRIGVYERNGTLIKLASPIRMVCLLTPCTYTLKISPGDSDYISFLNVQYDLSYNETTGMWIFTFVDTTQKTQEINLTIYKMTGDNIYAICTNSITAYTGAVSCNTSGYTGTLKAIAVRTASPPVILAQKIINAITSAFSSSFGLFISLIIGIPIIMILAFMSPIAAILGGVIALIPALYLGSVNWAIIGGLAVMAGIIIHMLKRIKN